MKSTLAPLMIKSAFASFLQALLSTAPTTYALFINNRPYFSTAAGSINFRGVKRDKKGRAPSGSIDFKATSNFSGCDRANGIEGEIGFVCNVFATLRGDLSVATNTTVTVMPDRWASDGKGAARNFLTQFAIELREEQNDAILEIEDLKRAVAVHQTRVDTCFDLIDEVIGANLVVEQGTGLVETARSIETVVEAAPVKQAKAAKKVVVAEASKEAMPFAKETAAQFSAAVRSVMASNKLYAAETFVSWNKAKDEYRVKGWRLRDGKRSPQFIAKLQATLAQKFPGAIVVIEKSNTRYSTVAHNLIARVGIDSNGKTGAPKVAGAAKSAVKRKKA